MLVWQCRDHRLTFGRPLVMGVLNVTPDSFSDGGRYADPTAARDHAIALVAAGADLLDVGGESTRPGAEPVDEAEELRRVLPVVNALAGVVRVPISVDTSKATVAEACLAAGASIVNDITGLRGDPRMPEVVRTAGAGAVVMHMRGEPRTMQDRPEYADAPTEVGQFFQARLRELTVAGIAPECLALDPGIGFGKTAAHNWAILRRLPEYAALGRPVVLGVSRKGILGTLTGRLATERTAASVAVACCAVAAGGAQIIRAHDVAETRDAMLVVEAMRE